MMPYELHLAVRYLRFHRGRTFISLITFISVAGVTVGTAALVIALSLMNGFVQDFRERILSGGAHLQVMHAFESTTPDAPALRDGLLEVPGVEAVAPVLFTHSMLLGEGGRQSYAEIYGIEPAGQVDVLEADESTRVALAYLDRSTDSGRPPLVLGEHLAENMGIFPGETVRVLVPKVTLSPFAPIPKSRTFEVVATYHSENFEQDATRAYAPIAVVQSLVRAGAGVSHLEVRISDLGELEERKAAIREALGAPWVVIDLIERNQMFIKALNEEKLYLFLAIWLIVVVAALNIVSTLILMVMDKVKDIGTLGAMGATPRGIAMTFLLQGAIIGLVGTVFGLGIGGFLAAWMDRVQAFPLDPEVYYLSHVRFVVQGADLVKAGFMAMGTALVATLYPAWRAATLDPVEAIRYE